MNKRVFYLILLLMLVITIFLLKQYLNIKHNTLNQTIYIKNLTMKIKKIYSLEQKYKFNKILLNKLNKLCNISQNNDKYIIECKNLDSKKFNLIQNIIFKHNYKINNFDIEKKDKAIFIKAEINK